MKVLVITGGISSERKISFISARAVKKALEKNGHKVKLFDLKKGYKALLKLSKNFDLIFPVIHGEEGEGGKLHKFLSKQNKPFVGGDWKSFKKGWYKIPFKKFCDDNKILTSPWKKVKSKKDIVKFGFPCVLKSSSGGSSREVIILNSFQDCKSSSCQRILKLDNLFVERFLEGVEVTVGILGNEHSSITKKDLQYKALPVVEIIPPEGEWFDYKNKYSDSTKELPNAPSLNPKIRQLVQKMAEEIHQKLNLGHYSRIDFIICDNIPYVLEVNTIPGLTPYSCLPKAAAAAGMSFPQFIDKLVSMALKKYGS